MVHTSARYNDDIYTWFNMECGPKRLSNATFYSIAVYRVGGILFTNNHANSTRGKAVLYGQNQEFSTTHTILGTFKNSIKLF